MSSTYNDVTMWCYWTTDTQQLPMTDVATKKKQSYLMPVAWQQPLHHQIHLTSSWPWHWLKRFTYQLERLLILQTFGHWFLILKYHTNDNLRRTHRQPESVMSVPPSGRGFKTVKEKHSACTLDQGRDVTQCKNSYSTDNVFSMDTNTDMNWRNIIRFI